VGFGGVVVDLWPADGGRSPPETPRLEIGVGIGIGIGIEEIEKIEKIEEIEGIEKIEEIEEIEEIEGIEGIGIDKKRDSAWNVRGQNVHSTVTAPTLDRALSFSFSSSPSGPPPSYLPTSQPFCRSHPVSIVLGSSLP
jgi:hypothetical protein